MKNKIIVLGISVLMLSGCGKIPTLSNGEDAVISMNNNDLISVDELYKQLKDTTGLSTLIQMLDQKILEKKYPDQVAQKKQEAESSVKSMKEAYGDQLLTAIQNYTGYQTVEAYQNSLYMTSMQDLAIKDYVKSLITEKEEKKYYDDTLFGDITLSHILITSKATSSSTSEEKTKAENEAKETINKIIDELNKAENKAERFKELAKEYSEDTKTKDNGGALGSINLGTLDKNYDELLKTANGLKDGAYSKSIITTELGYHVIFRESQKEKASFEDLKDKIIETLVDNKITADQTLKITALEELRKSYGVEFHDEELSKQYKTYIANQKAQIEQNKAKNK